MSKINIKVTIQNEENTTTCQTQAILQDNLLKYQEEEDTMVIYDYENNTLLRENSELKMNYSFSRGEKTTGEIIIKELKRRMPIEINTKSIEKEKNNILVEFLIDNQTFIYKVEEII